MLIPLFVYQLDALESKMPLNDRNNKKLKRRQAQSHVKISATYSAMMFFLTWRHPEVAAHANKVPILSMLI